MRIATSNWERAQALQEGIVPIANRTRRRIPWRKCRRASTPRKNAWPSSGRASTMPGPEAHSAARTQGANAGSGGREGGVRLVQTEVERSKSRQDRLQILEARLKEVHAKAERARQSLQDTVLRSPIDGVISRKRVEEGQLVQNGQPVLVISDPKDVWILANIKESYIREVAVGKPVDITVDAYPDRRFEGKVETIGAAAISEFALFPPTGSFTKVEQRIPVQITVANSDGLLKPGMMVIIGIVKD